MTLMLMPPGNTSAALRSSPMDSHFGVVLGRRSTQPFFCLTSAGLRFPLPAKPKSEPTQSVAIPPGASLSRARWSLEPRSCKLREAFSTPTCSRCTGILSWARRRGFRLPMVLLSLICRSPCLCCRPPLFATHGHCQCGRRPSSFE